MNAINHKVRMVLAAGVVLAVAAAVTILSEHFAMFVRESILAEDTVWLSVRVAIGALCGIVALTALGVSVRKWMMHGGRERVLASDFCAMVSFAAVLPIAVLVTIVVERELLCDCMGLLLAELLLFPAFSILVAIRTGKICWIAWLALYFIATAIVVLYPAVNTTCM